MENLSIDGLTPEQIAELQASIKKFKRQNEPPKFYKSVCWIEHEHHDHVGSEFYFLFKSCSVEGKIHLELISPKEHEEAFEIYKQSIIKQNPSSITDTSFENLSFNSDEEYDLFYESCDAYASTTTLIARFEHVEISEEEYNNSHTWLAPTVETKVVTKINW